MASSPEFVQYVCDQLSMAGNISSRKMFGEYGLHMEGKFIGCICDDQLFIKVTDAGKAVIGKEKVELAPPYEGAKPYLLIAELEDREMLKNLMKKTWAELPEPKPKKKKKKIAGD